MSARSAETVGVRYTGWAALHRDPQEDPVTYTCPHCGAEGRKQARPACRECHRSLHLAPIVLVHDQDEMKRFEAVFVTEALVSKN